MWLERKNYLLSLCDVDNLAHIYGIDSDNFDSEGISEGICGRGYNYLDSNNNTRVNCGVDGTCYDDFRQTCCSQLSSSDSGSLTLVGSGSTLLDVQGSQGQLFSVTDDLLGLSGFYPKFLKKYANLNKVIEKGIQKYKNDVQKRKFPQRKNSY